MDAEASSPIVPSLSGLGASHTRRGRANRLHHRSVRRMSVIHRSGRAARWYCGEWRQRIPGQNPGRITEFSGGRWRAHCARLPTCHFLQSEAALANRSRSGSSAVPHDASAIDLRRTFPLDLADEQPALMNCSIDDRLLLRQFASNQDARPVHQALNLRSKRLGTVSMGVI